MDEMISDHRSGQLARVLEKVPTLVSDPGASKKCARCPKYDSGKEEAGK